MPINTTFSANTLSIINQEKSTSSGPQTPSAKQYATSTKNKNDLKNGFIKILIHGFLHLLRFNHELDKEYKIMNSIENKIFQKVKR